MKRNELKRGDILVVDHSDVLGWRPTCYYVVMGDIAVCFKGDVNFGNRPMGWLDRIDEDDDLPMGAIAVYRPTHITYTFNGDFENPKYYTCVWRAEDED